MKEKIKFQIKKIIASLTEKGDWPNIVLPNFNIDRPAESKFGDYALSLPLKLAGIFKKPPLEIAAHIAARIKTSSDFKKYFEKIEVASPGFINFFLSENYIKTELKNILKKGDQFGRSRFGKNKKVLIEFISANPTGQLHIGHGRGAFFGDVLGNLLNFAGFKVQKEYYVNDAKNSNQIRALGKTALGKSDTYLNDYLKKKIKEIKQKLKNIKDEGEAGYFLAGRIQKDNEKFIKNKLKINFDQWFKEESLYPEKTNKIFKGLEKKNLIYEKDGAVWLRTSQFGDFEDRVVVRSNREPTYFLPDIAYHEDKFSRGFQKLINIWGADHQGHVIRLKAVQKMLGWKGELDILISQIVSLKSEKGAVKMSKRKGQIVTLAWLVEEVGLDSARFFYLTKSLDTQMEFDLDLALKTSKENPVFYIQYAYARISSIFRKSPKNLSWKNFNSHLLKNSDELELLKKMIIFPEILEETAQNYQIHRLTEYALDLAGVFHDFYEKTRVISENKELTRSRLALVFSVQIVLNNLLSILGITRPKRM
ncbi:MAG: arginine--tRNA ligase [Parcubacteria group bacterium]|nr:arginine--tRNA ligase [Parcubacteria group bacterium]